MFVMYISEWRWNLGPKALHPTPQNGGRVAGVVEATGEQFNPRWSKDDLEMDYLLQKSTMVIYKKNCNACLFNSDGGSVIHKVFCTAIKMQTSKKKKW